MSKAVDGIAVATLEVAVATSPEVVDAIEAGGFVQATFKHTPEVDNLKVDYCQFKKAFKSFGRALSSLKLSKS